MVFAKLGHPLEINSSGPWAHLDVKATKGFQECIVVYVNLWVSFTLFDAKGVSKWGINVSAVPPPWVSLTVSLTS